MIEQYSSSMVTSILDLCAVEAADRPEGSKLLQAPVTESVRNVLAALDARWGWFPAEGMHRPAGIDELSWQTGLLRFAATTAERLESSGISPAIIEATLGDVGNQFALHRRMHGTFGMATDWWSTLHLSGSLFRIGRLQFHLHRNHDAGPWVLGLHIPQDGPLDAVSVDQSCADAAAFFARHFGDRVIDHAYCDSWLLDPYLSAHRPESNIAAFAARFGEVQLRDEPGDALYFTFRAQPNVDISTLPRKTSLQSLVLERIKTGGVWQCGKGTAPWPMAIG